MANRKSPFKSAMRAQEDFRKFHRDKHLKRRTKVLAWMALGWVLVFVAAVAVYGVR
jgi:hypothetical protein